MEDAPAIALDRVTLRYHVDQTPTLENITLTIPRGGFVYVRGSSGAGKSTLLRVIYQDLRPSEGTVRLFGQDAAHMHRCELPSLRRKIGVMFQDYRLLPHLTVEENVALPLVVRGIDTAQALRDVRELLAWVGLSEKSQMNPERLSGGEQQRVSVARAIVARPQLLVADEPTASLDDMMAVRLMYLFEELNRMGTTILMATHNEALVSRFPHQQLYLEEGRLSALITQKEQAA